MSSYGGAPNPLPKPTKAGFTPRVPPFLSAEALRTAMGAVDDRHRLPEHIYPNLY